MLYVAERVCKTAKGGVREWYPSTIGPLLPTMPRNALLPVHNIEARTEHCVQRTLPVRTVFFWDIIIRWTRGGGGYLGLMLTAWDMELFFFFHFSVRTTLLVLARASCQVWFELEIVHDLDSRCPVPCWRPAAACIRCPAEGLAVVTCLQTTCFGWRIPIGYSRKVGPTRVGTGTRPGQSDHWNGSGTTYRPRCRL